jgi:hypothetical protein
VYRKSKFTSHPPPPSPLTISNTVGGKTLARSAADL